MLSESVSSSGLVVSFHCAEANKHLMEVYEMHNPKTLFLYAVIIYRKCFQFMNAKNIFLLEENLIFCQ